MLAKHGAGSTIPERSANDQYIYIYWYVSFFILKNNYLFSPYLLLLSVILASLRIMMQSHEHPWWRRRI